jgi:hypothetical protein
MTDRGEREVRRWAMERNGDPLEPTDVVSLVFAFADDHEADHEETMSLIALASERHDDLCARVIALEEWKLDSQRKCVDRVKRLIDEEHQAMHGEHMASHHTEEEARQNWLMWLVGGKVAYIIIAVVIAFLVTLLNVSLKYVWFGTP